MKTHGLSPGEPITLKVMLAYMEGAAFVDQLLRLANKLFMEYQWTTIPNRYREGPEVKNRWGRVGLEFPARNWAPALTLGFLYSTHDHRVSFLNPKRGIDLMLRIEANPTVFPNPVKALEALAEKATALRRIGTRVLLKGDNGNGNRNTLMIAQVNLASVIDGKASEREQVETIHAVLTGWLTVLFADRKLEKALETIKA